MKKNKMHSQGISRISRRDHLPLLRGMFVIPEKTGRGHKQVQGNMNVSFPSEEGLFLTAEQGCYLGE